MRLSFISKNAPPLPPPLPEVVLASQSIGRKMLLEKLGIRFRVVVTRLDEDKITDADPIVTLKKRAEAKANEVISHARVYTLAENRPNLLIAADSMAIIGKKMFGKAKDREHAKFILKALMGRVHTFVTATNIVLLKEGKVNKTWERLTKTRVTMRKLSKDYLDSYVARYDFTRFAAGYALGETPWDLVTKIDGSYTNVIGLPFEVLLPVLRHIKILI